MAEIVPNTLTAESSENSIPRKPVRQIFAEHREKVFKLLATLTFACLVAYCVVGAVMLLVGCVKLIPNQQENTYPESSILYEAMLSARTGQLYFPLLQRPYLSQPYGPLFYVANRAIANSANLNLTETMIRARTAIFTCYVICGLVIYAICKRVYSSALSASLAMGMFLGLPTFLYWNTSVRPDIPFLLAMLLCLFFALETRLNSSWSFVISGLFAAAGCLLKQTAIAAPIAVLLVMLVARRYKEVSVFVVSAGVPVAITAFLLYRKHEPFLEQSSSVAKGALWSFGYGIQWIWHELPRITVAVPILIAALGIWLVRNTNYSARMVTAFAILNWVVFAATIPQRGGGHNYILPGLASCCLFLPAVIKVIRERYAASWLLLPVAALLVWATLDGASYLSRLFWGHLKPQIVDYSGLRSVRILSDNPYFTLQGRDPEMLDPFLFHSLEITGHWKSDLVVDEINKGSFDLVVFSCSNYNVVCSYRGIALFSREVVNALNQNYVIMCSTRFSLVMEPRDHPTGITPELLTPVLKAPCGIGRRGVPPRIMFPSDLR